MANTIVSTAETLSVNFSPGQDKRFPNTSSESIFTFGDFRLQHSSSSEILNPTKNTSSFSNFSTLESLSAVTYNPQEILSTTENELNPSLSDPQSYAYFGSFYTRVATSINNVLATFPYAMLATSSANTITNYSSDSFADTSSFSIPISAITNQGSVIFSSGASDSGRVLTLFDNFNQFGIQLSGVTANTHTYTILAYNYSSGSTGTLNFTVDGVIFSGTTTGSTLPVYIRPSPQRYGQFSRTMPHLDYQVFFDGSFMVPDPDDESTFITQKFIWPKSIDGFNPDGSGSEFTTFTTDILQAAQLVDDSKTNWMVRAMIPENYLELDTDSQIYRKLLTVYAAEFDKLKHYIDGLAFAHTVTYDAQENIPDKFLHRLSNLLGFRYQDAFTDSDVFEYLASEDDDGKTLSDYNLELWKRILVSINWLYKKKGTRDAIMFIFKLVGAPDCLVNFNEFVYNVNQTISSSVSGNTKINSDGYPNYDNSEFVFQEGGDGRGNGQKYINQWAPEFDPLRTIDNKKVYTGGTEFLGTQNVMNSKEAEINLVSASAIECDVKDWLDLGYGTWLWGSNNPYPYNVTSASGLFSTSNGGFSASSVYNGALSYVNTGGTYFIFSSSTVQPGKYVLAPGAVINEGALSDYAYSTGSTIDGVYLGVGLWTGVASVNPAIVLPIFPSNPYASLPLSAMTVPFEWTIDNVYGVAPQAITGMTIAQWMDFIYASNVNPTNRKTYGKGQVQGVYHDLKRIYITYMLWTNNEESNRLTFHKLEKFLDLIERNFMGYIPQLVPATTIFDSATVYRNTVFNRQKFVYPEGVNRGSEFQNDIPPQPEAQIEALKITNKINDIIRPELDAFSITARANDIIHPELPVFDISAKADTGILADVAAFSVAMDVNPQVELVVLPDRQFVGTKITFPNPIIMVTASTINGG